MKILFIAWDGPQVQYLRSLFIPIFVRLQEFGYEFHVLHCTWGAVDDQDVEACVRAGIGFSRMRVLRGPSVAVGATLSVIHLSKVILSVARDYAVDVLMPRSTLPVMGAMLANRRLGLPLVFDADGLPLDERVDFGGRSSSSIMQRVLRDMEAEAVRLADRVLTRSNAATRVLIARAGAGVDTSKFHLITNGRCEETYRPASEERINHWRVANDIAMDAPCVMCVGSMGQQYRLDRVFRFFQFLKARRHDARLTICTGDPCEASRLLVESECAVGGIEIRRVPAEQIPATLALADVGLAFRQPSFSMQGVAPIKLGEYLLCGLPVVCSTGVGDTDAVKKAARLVDGFEDFELDASAEWVVEQVMPHRRLWREKARDVGVRHFSLEATVTAYRQALAEVR